MSLANGHSDEPSSVAPSGAARQQIRGSTLLLLGRCVALLINLAVQIVTVRYLATEDFGAFAFGISMVALGTNLSLLGLTKALSRFVPIFHETDDRERLAGAILLMFGTVVGLGLATVALVLGSQSMLAARVTGDGLSLSLLLVLIVLVPIDAVDRLLESLFAAFGNVRSIFIRRHLVGPGMKLLAVLAVVCFDGSVLMLSICYVGAGIAGLILYSTLLHRLLVEQQLLDFFRPDRVKFPTREIFGYSLPLVVSQVGFVVRTSVAVLLLEMLRGSESVAELRAVLPFARLNEVVVTSFAFLFTPLASRMFVRNDTTGIDQLYWRTSVWIMMFSLPVFLVTGILAVPFTSFVLGERYATAGPVLLVLASGFFLDAVMGFNGHTLRVFAKVRGIVLVDLVTIATAVGLCLTLIPLWGAMGAAVAICSATVAQNVLYQFLMRFTTGVGVLHWHYVRFYTMAGLAIATMAIVQWAWGPPLWLGVLLAAAIYVAMFAANRTLMDLDDTFPELSRIPFVGPLLCASNSPQLTATAKGRP